MGMHNNPRQQCTLQQALLTIQSSADNKHGVVTQSYISVSHQRAAFAATAHQPTYVMQTVLVTVPQPKAHRAFTVQGALQGS
jgi:hypothetical protein